MSKKYRYIDTVFLRRNSIRGTFITTDGNTEYEYCWGSTLGLQEHTPLIANETNITLCLLKENDKIISAKIK